ncbi:uncharacterized mitochondrial protein AtMg00810-like [Manihot esculenta]|uniref:uncharacterized mitochondrial protein AtMg00810-like n=1 Tax=Manihot esculenta TaxID=3983 RepID=UPI000B5D5D90|nr:uncharacterized mitochondrial protein AtMg00810-like [Manihot esculenta]
MNDHLLSLGFVKSLSESTLYIKKNGADLTIVSIYVDDLLITGSKQELIDCFKAEMFKEFEMTDLGLMSYFLGLEVRQRKNEIFINQSKYAKEILKKFHMEGCKPVDTPMQPRVKFYKDDGAVKVNENHYRSLLGCLMYLSASRPDIMHAVGLLSRFMHCASEEYLQAAKRVMRYIKGTIDFGVKYVCCPNFKLVGFSDSDWAGSVDDMKSTTGFCFNFGSGAINWCSRKQEIIAQSTAEAEFVAAAAATNHALWLRKILKDLNEEQVEPTSIFVDNQVAISISSNPVFHGKTKHFKIKFYFIREIQKEGEVLLVYCRAEDQIADGFTKALPKAKFADSTNKMGVCSIKDKEEC